MKSENLALWGLLGGFLALFISATSNLDSGFCAAEGPANASTARQVIYLGDLLHLLVKFETFLELWLVASAPRVEIDHLLIISVYVQVIFIIFDARRELFLFRIFLRVWHSLLGKSLIYLVAFLFLFFFIVLLRRDISDLCFSVGHIDRLNHDIEGVPYVTIIAFFECVEFTIIGTPIRIDLRVLVPIEYPAHCPLTVNEAAVAHLQVCTGVAAWASDALHLFQDGVHAEPFVYHDKLFEGEAFRVLAIAQPRKTISYLSIPRGIIFPINFLNVLNCVESKVYPQWDLEALGDVWVHSRLIGECWADKWAIVREHVLSVDQ